MAKPTLEEQLEQRKAGDIKIDWKKLLEVFDECAEEEEEALVAEFATVED